MNDDIIYASVVVVMALLIAFGVVCGSCWIVVPFVIAMIILARLEADAISYILFGFLVWNLMTLFYMLRMTSGL